MSLVSSAVLQLMDYFVFNLATSIS